jgi:hypothetical protein
MVSRNRMDQIKNTFITFSCFFSTHKPRLKTTKELFLAYAL